MLFRFLKSAYKAVCLLLTVVLLSGSIPSVCYAKASTAQQIKDKENEKNALEDEMEENEEELEGLKGTQKSLKSDLQGLNQELTQISERLEELEQQIADKEAEIAVTQEDLQAARDKEAWQYESMQKRIQLSYELGASTFFEALLKADSFADLLNLADYLASMVAYDNQKLDEIIETREYIESEEARLYQENEELKALKEEALSEQNRVNELIDKVSRNISSYASQIAQAEREAEEYEKALDTLNNDLEALYKQYEEELKMSQSAANGVWRDISDITFADGDLKLLANLIYCEAGGEPYEGQVAVGAVVINRVRSEKFPNTVVGVIYQKNQFSPVASGRLELALAQDKATEKCYQAAREAMAGVTNVGNCVFFRTPIEGITGINIGGHVFY